MKYPFDVNNTLYWMGELADLIFVFFDPIGQAFCKRTLDIIEKLNVDYANKVRLYLSKIDEVRDEADRQKVMMQIVQELCRRKGLNRTGFEMPSISIPDAERKSNHCANQIEALCKEIERTIENTVQHTLNTLGKDAENITMMLDMQITRDSRHKAENGEKTFAAIKYGLVFTILFIKYFLFSSLGKGLLKLVIGQYATTLIWILDPIEIWLPDIYGKFMPHLILLMIIGGFSLYKYKDWTYKPRLSSRQRKRCLSLRTHLNSVTRSKELLYKEYLAQCVSDQDL